MNLNARIDKLEAAAAPILQGGCHCYPLYVCVRREGPMVDTGPRDEQGRSAPPPDADPPLACPRCGGDGRLVVLREMAVLHGH